VTRPSPRSRRAAIAVVAVLALVAIAWMAGSDGDDEGDEALVVASRVGPDAVVADLGAADSPLAIDPTADDADVRCVADRLVADLGDELTQAGFDGDGELGDTFHAWAFGSIPPPDDVHVLWDAVFSCVDGATFVERQAGLTGSPTASCVVDQVLADREVRLMFVYGVRPGAKSEPMGPLNDWLRRYETFAANCPVSPSS
jgi:hypothetical protein